ncbi:MAG: PaaI family thioesterase, partial [Steroidobacteraceae bacterium]
MEIPAITLERLNQIGVGKLPGHLGIVITHADQTELRAELKIGETHMAPNGFLHAGTVVTLADTCAGYGCIAHLPPGATGFTTLELKSNHLSTAREGT